MFGTAVRFGSFYGGAVSVLLLGPLLLGFEERDLGRAEVIGYAAMVLATAFVFLGVRHLARQEGSLSFGRAFLAGVSISLVAGVLFGIATAAFYVVSPEFTDKYIAFQLEQMQSAGASLEDVSRKRAEFESMRWFFDNPLLQGLLMLATVLPIGVVASLIAATFLRRGAPSRNA